MYIEYIAIRISSNIDLMLGHTAISQAIHADVIKWKHFPRYWPFVRGINRVAGEFPAQRPVTRGFDVFLDLGLNERLSKQIVRLVIWDAIAAIMTS